MILQVTNLCAGVVASFPNERISPLCVRNVSWGQDVSCRNSHTMQLKSSLLYGGLAFESRGVCILQNQCFFLRKKSKRPLTPPPHGSYLSATPPTAWVYFFKPVYFFPQGTRKGLLCNSCYLCDEDNSSKISNAPSTKTPSTPTKTPSTPSTLTSKKHQNWRIQIPPRCYQLLLRSSCMLTDKSFSPVCQNV